MYVTNDFYLLPSLIINYLEYFSLKIQYKCIVKNLEELRFMIKEIKSRFLFYKTPDDFEYLNDYLI